MKTKTARPIAQNAPLILMHGKPSIPQGLTKAAEPSKPITIEVMETPEGMFKLMVRSAAGLSPVGWRLQRGEPMPTKVEAWECFTEAEAREEAAKLQGYVDEYHNATRKRRSTK